MTFLSYELPEGAPQRLVWFAECDVCRKSVLGPIGNTPKINQRAIAEDAGWRYQGKHPMDTCPSCLAHAGEMWRDRDGDVWTLGADGLLHSPETAPFSREHVEKKWGPLEPLLVAELAT